MTGDTPGSPESKLERSNAFIDHTFVKAQSDNSYPAATYTLEGNLSCNIGVTAVSRKTHGTAGTFDINLPLTGTPGIECRTGQGTNSNFMVIPVCFSKSFDSSTSALAGSQAAQHKVSSDASALVWPTAAIKAARPNAAPVFSIVFMRSPPVSIPHPDAQAASAMRFGMNPKGHCRISLFSNFVY